MISLLAKLFIKDSKNYSDVKVREKYGILCGGFGVFLNVMLFVLKFIFGTIAASVSMVADALNNLSDAASSGIQILGFKLSSKKPDPEHPFGHGRLEYITGLIVSFLILHMGIGLMRDSINAVIHPEAVQADVFSIAIMICAILVKFYMYFYNHSVGKKINSVSMEVVAKDSLGDMISTAVVIIALIAGKFTSFPVDGVGGIIVGIFILKTGIEAAGDTIKPLLGTAPSKELVHDIEEELMKFKPIVGMHDLVVHDYGPGRMMISLHAEVPGHINIFELHDVIDQAEVSIALRFNCNVVIHMDPIDTENQRLSELKVCIKEKLNEINPELHFHDVRMVPGITHTNLIFDVVKPFSCELTDEQLKLAVHKAINEVHKDVFCVITVDQPFVS